MVEERTHNKVGQWSEPALRVLRERYLRDGETPEEMCWRVARAIAAAEAHWGASPEKVEEIAGEFYDLMVDQVFLPNSPTLMNAGKESRLQYSACYVLPVGDSMVEIFEAIKRAALIHQSGGGTGFSFSRLRPKDSLVRSSGGRASGPVSFMRVFNWATEAVKQGGTRRGANMGILRVDHPDILEFIDCKLDGGIANFNISVAVTDEFMKALEEDADYELVAPHTGEVTGRLRAREVFDRIVRAAWRTGDPGVIFIDRINAGRANPTPELGQVEATNPCGEQPLLPNEACNLGSLNLSRFVVPAEGGTWPASGLDWAGLEQAVRKAVRFLDDVIEVNPYPLPEIDVVVKGNRRIGLGVMGWADLLFELGIPYASDEALALAQEVMAFINRVGHDESARLAEVRGPFPNWQRSIYRDGPPLRNATVTTIAPTGSISILAGASSGIEPVFALAFHHVVGERRLHIVNPVFQRVVEMMGLASDAVMAQVAETGSAQGILQLPPKVRQTFVTAHEVAPEWHVKMQAAFQRHTDNAVSKTVNLPHDATVEDVRRVYLLAHELGCLGITVYRDGCKEEQVLRAGRQGEKVSIPRTIKPRPAVVRGVTHRIETPLGTAYITINENGAGEPFEVFANVGKAGSDTAAVAEALGRLISLCLRLPSPLSPRERLEEIVVQLSGIGGGRPLGFGPQRVRSLPDALAQVLAQHLGMAERAPAPEQMPLPLDRVGDLCPECGEATLVYAEGCRKCYSCGYSEC
ncbi:MAG: vitamin B12-dependent ribonucleotide reductase [Anaerolineae bacterium]